MKKVRIKQRLCKSGAIMIMLCYLFAILSVYEPRLMPLLIVLLVDTVLVVIPSYFGEQKEMKE